MSSTTPLAPIMPLAGEVGTRQFERQVLEFNSGASPKFVRMPPVPWLSITATS